MDQTLYLKVSYVDGKLQYQMGEKKTSSGHREGLGKILDFLHVPRSQKTTWEKAVSTSGEEELASRVVDILEHGNFHSLYFRPHCINLTIHQAEHYLSATVRKKLPHVKLPFENMNLQS